MGQRDDVIVWMDLEMTGLDPDECRIVQLAMILTDHDLNQIADPIDLVVWQPEEVLGRMSPYVTDMHQKTGLLDRIRSSTLDTEGAQTEAMRLLSQHASYKTARLAGNSVWQDRRFLVRYMPSLTDYMHYRLVDVSSIKELALWWYKLKYTREPGAKHDALYDIQQSIEELRFYREGIMR